jgi:hypothetical protein
MVEASKVTMQLWSQSWQLETMTEPEDVEAGGCEDLVRLQWGVDWIVVAPQGRMTVRTAGYEPFIMR